MAVLLGADVLTCPSCGGEANQPFAFVPFGQPCQDRFHAGPRAPFSLLQRFESERFPRLRPERIIVYCDGRILTHAAAAQRRAAQ